MGDLLRAVDRLEGRKDAAGLSPETEAPEQAMRAVLSEFDLNREELAVVRQGIVESALVGAASGHLFTALIDGTWVDGLVTGLLLAEERQKAEAS